MKTLRELINIIESQQSQPLAEGVMDRLRRIYMGLVYDTPMGTPDSEFLAQWQREIKAQLGQNIDLGTLARLQQNFRERGRTMMARGDAADYHREMGIREQGVAEGSTPTYVLNVMDETTGEHWSIEVKASSADQARQRAQQQGLKVLRVKEKGVAEGSEQVYRVLAVDKSNALSKQVKLKVKASSLDEVFERLAISDWYPLEINDVEVVNGKRLKQGASEGDQGLEETQQAQADPVAEITRLSRDINR